MMTLTKAYPKKNQRPRQLRGAHYKPLRTFKTIRFKGLLTIGVTRFFAKAERIASHEDVRF